MGRYVVNSNTSLTTLIDRLTEKNSSLPLLSSLIVIEKRLESIIDCSQQWGSMRLFLAFSSWTIWALCGITRNRNKGRSLCQPTAGAKRQTLSLEGVLARNTYKFAEKLALERYIRCALLLVLWFLYRQNTL